MTGTETTFLVNLNNAQVACVNKISTQIWIGDPDKLTMRKMKVALLEAMVEIIEYWFRDTTDDDDNCFTSVEIQDVIDHANKIMGTVLYIDLTDY